MTHANIIHINEDQLAVLHHDIVRVEIAVHDRVALWYAVQKSLQQIVLRLSHQGLCILLQDRIEHLDHIREAAGLRLCRMELNEHIKIFIDILLPVLLILHDDIGKRLCVEQLEQCAVALLTLYRFI